MDYRPATILFACPNDEQGIAEAKKYILDEGYSNTTVRILRTDKQILVEKI